MTILHIDRISARYDDNQVISDFSLQVAEGELLALLGPSGCGKTTILKIIAGLHHPISGNVSFDQEPVLAVPAERRGAAMVFQKPLLFPYLTVAENVAFGLKMRRVPVAETRRRVQEALRLVQLEGLEHRKPSELSGGQEQRVALARALVTEPRVLLLDEPFSALDESLRGDMRLLVRDLQRRLRITTIFVTHDQAEAALMADRIALILAGRLAQIGEPREFYLAPATPQTARFFGWKLMSGRVSGHLFETPDGSFVLPGQEVNKPDVMAWQPEQADLRFPARLLVDTANNLAGKIETRTDLGRRINYRVTLKSGDQIEISQPVANGSAMETLSSGTEVVVHIPSHATRFFQSEPGL